MTLMEYLGSDKPVNKIQPLVSVVVITYNHKNYIKECLDSVLMQETDFPFEIILGEDDSTDGTREICIEYAEKYPEKIRLFLREEKDKIYINGNKSGRFNLLQSLKAARGEFIALCDGDDFWISIDKIQKQFDIFKSNEEISFSFTNGEVLNEVSNFRKDNTTITLKSGLVDLNIVGKNFWVQAASMMFRKKIFDFNDFSMLSPKAFGADYLVLIICAKNGLLHYSEEKTFCYRIHSNSWMRTTKRSKGKIDKVGLWAEVNKYLDYKYAPMYQEMIVEQYRKLEKKADRLSDPKQAIKDWLKGILKF